MKRFFTQDRIIVGLVAGIGSELVTTLLLAAVLLISGLGISGHERWFGIMFVPILLILRAYAKSKTHLIVTKTLIIVFFLTFLAFVFYLFQAHILVLK